MFFIRRSLFLISLSLQILICQSIFALGLIPGGGEHFIPFSTVSIAWPTRLFNQNETVNLFLLNDKAIVPIGNEMASRGVFDWFVPNVIPGEYKIKVQSANRPAITIESDSYFTIGSQDGSVGLTELGDVRVYNVLHTDFVKAEWLATNGSVLRVRNIINAAMLQYDVTGRQDITIDCSAVPSGFYLIDVQCEDGTTLYGRFIFVK